MALAGYRKFISRDMEGRSFPAIGRLDLDETLASILVKAGDVIAKTVAVLIGDPSHLSRQIMPPSLDKGGALVAQNDLFTGPAQSTIALVTASDVILHRDGRHQPRIDRWGFVAVCWRRP